MCMLLLLFISLYLFISDLFFFQRLFQVVAALALTESPIFEEKGMEPIAQVYFVPSQ